MRRTWPFYVAIVGVGALAGAAVAGRPTSFDGLVIDPSRVTTTTVATSVDGAAPSTSATTDEPATTDETAAVSTTEASASATTSASVASAGPTTSELITATLPRNLVRVVLANGDGRFNLVGINANRLLEAGYVEIAQTDVADRPPATLIYVRPGFEDEAEVLRTDLGVPGATITPLPDAPVTAADASGDIVVILGPDALR